MAALHTAMLWYSVVLFVVCAFAARGNAGPATMPEVYDTIIVGMGAAGCTAASTLSKAGRKVLALEAMDRVGGRVNTVPFGDGVVELGAEWIHGQFSSRVYDIAIQNNVTILPQDLDFDVYRSDGSAGDKELLNDLITFSLGVVDDPPEVPEPLGRYITRRLTDYIKTKYPHLLNDKDFMDNLLQFLDLIIDNYESSNSWNDVSTQSRYEELGGHQHMSWHRHGYRTLFQILLNTYNNGPGYPNLHIKLQKEVTQISWPQDPAQDVVVTCKDGSTYRARNVIVTVSLGVLKERQSKLFSPSLPEEKVTSIDKISVGVEGKIILHFDTPWYTGPRWIFYLWKGVNKEGLSKEDDWATKVIEASIPMGFSNAITLWTTGDRAKLGNIKPKSKLLPAYGTLLGVRTSALGVVMVAQQAEDYRLNSDPWLKQGHEKLFTPSLPQEKMTSIDKLSIGVVGKVILLFEESWWNRPIWFPFIWRHEDRQKLSKEDEWVTNFSGVSPPLGNTNAITLWSCGDVAKLVETLPEDVVKRKVMELLRRFMGKNRTIPEPIAMLRSSWFSNPYTRGSYTYDNVLTPQFPNARATLAQPLVDSSGAPRVLFAGEATDNTHFSTVHGATDTGFREANRLLPQAKL